MKKILQSSFLAAAIIGSSATGALAGLTLAEWGFNINGMVSDSVYDPVPGEVNVTLFDFSTGLGTITYTSSVSGYFLAFFDHEIDETADTFFNEYGSVSGTTAADLSWEIDEPGYYFGDIYDNFRDGALDNTNGVPDSDPDDVSMAMGWSFTLAADETALITLILGTEAPSGFYLSQIDPDSNKAIYFSSNRTINNGTNPVVPEPGSMLLMGSGLAGLLAVCRKKRKNK